MIDDPSWGKIIELLTPFGIITAMALSFSISSISLNLVSNSMNALYLAPNNLKVDYGIWIISFEVFIKVYKIIYWLETLFASTVEQKI